jgi:cysteine desulfurase family protein (TIGR01976 family)
MSTKKCGTPSITLSDLTSHLAWIRAQFPALSQQVEGQQVLFLDGPGGTQVPERVLDAIRNYLIFSNANTHGSFATSQRTDATMTAARSAMADLLGAEHDEIVFGPNMTTLTFALSRAVGRELRPGDEIVVTRLDHDANVSPWKSLEERGVRVQMVDINPSDCTLDMDDMARKISRRTKLVAVGWASNAVGTINDIPEVVRQAHRVGALVFVDAVHYAPHGPIDVRALDCDFLACSPYKFFAPHLGTLYAKREHLNRLRPDKVRAAADEHPGSWEMGTNNHEGLAGLVAAIEYLSELGGRVDPNATERRRSLLSAMEAIRRYEEGLIKPLIHGLLGIRGLTLYGITDAAERRVPTVSMRIAGFTPRELAGYLGRHGIFAWDGNFYALGLTERLGIEASGGLLRFGLVHYNTQEEVFRVLETLREIIQTR